MPYRHKRRLGEIAQVFGTHRDTSTRREHIIIKSYHSDQNASAPVHWRKWYEVHKHTALRSTCVITRDVTDSRNS